MTWRQAFQAARAQLVRPWRAIGVLALLLALCCSYPSDLGSYRDGAAPDSAATAVLQTTDQYGRFANTALQVGLPLLFADKVGAVQLLWVAVSTTTLTHGLKRILNRQEVAGTRLGERPRGSQTKHNMPSGHSSMASCAAFFVCRRYGWRWAFIVLPILALTMTARVSLLEHTWRSVLRCSPAPISAMR
jgi:membrane-associated phospholipid phosphatase